MACMATDSFSMDYDDYSDPLRKAQSLSETHEMLQ